MRIVRNSIIPLKGYKAINLFGILFCRKEVWIDAADLMHEEIHTAQMKEMLYIPFYLWYGIEFLIRLAWYRSCFKAYRNMGFEQEAYLYEQASDYLDRRKPYEWFRYI